MYSVVSPEYPNPPLIIFTFIGCVKFPFISISNGSIIIGIPDVVGLKFIENIVGELSFAASCSISSSE